jgi:hypothetical protein
METNKIKKKLEITIDGTEQAKEFRLFLHRINEFGIDRVCDIIESSIKSEETSDSYVISYSTLFKDKNK